jgi:hypothetical protein
MNFKSQQSRNTQETFLVTVYILALCDSSVHTYQLDCRLSDIAAEAVAISGRMHKSNARFPNVVSEKYILDST